VSRTGPSRSVWLTASAPGLTKSILSVLCSFVCPLPCLIPPCHSGSPGNSDLVLDRRRGVGHLEQRRQSPEDARQPIGSQPQHLLDGDD